MPNLRGIIHDHHQTDAAADGIVAAQGQSWGVEYIRDGMANGDPTVQSYARHAAAERAIERAAIVAMIERDFDAPHNIALARKIIATIRALSDNAEAIARGE